MKKSVLTSLIAASALFTGVAFAGSYTADAGYTAADTSAMTSETNSFLQDLYVGVGFNKSATSTNTETQGVDETADDNITSSKYGFNLLLGKHLNETFAAELSYNSYGKNEYTDETVVTTYSPQWSTMLLAVVNSASYHGVSAHAKLGASYNSVTTHVDTDGVQTSESQYRGANPAFGFGVQYNYDQFGLSLDWTRVQTQASGTNGDESAYIPDVYSLNFIYNI